MTTAMRTLLLATALLATAATAALGQAKRDDTIAAPKLRANVSVSSEVVRFNAFALSRNLERSKTRWPRI